MRVLHVVLALSLIGCSGAPGPGSSPDLAADVIIDVFGGDLLEVTATDSLDEVGLDAQMDLPPEIMDVTPLDVTPLDVIPLDVPPEPDPIPFVEIERDPWGGYADLSVGEGTGWFSTAIHGGRAWLKDPDGNAFFSLGIQAVGFGSLTGENLGYEPGHLAQYAKYLGEVGSLDEIRPWVKSQQLDTMLEHGFNTMGGWSSGSQAPGKIPYTRNLSFMSGCGGDAVPTVSSGGIRDVFDPVFGPGCLAYAQGAVSAEEAADPWFIGYYIDNELRWYGGDLFVPDPLGSLVDDFVDEAAETPGKQAFAAMMQARYGDDLDAFNQAYGLELADWAGLLEITELPFDPDDPGHRDDRDAFLGAVADAYYGAVDAALDETIPDHLNLCDRIAEVAPLPVFRMAGKHCDVVTVNDYYIESDPMIDFMLGAPPEERWAAQSGAAFEGAGGVKPMIITEYGIRGADSGHPNTYGAGKTVPTQQDRAEFYEWSSRWFLERSHEGVGYVAGWHWFMYTDEPPTGRSMDPEDCNYGVVTLRNERYAFLFQAMSHVNTWVDGLLIAAVDAMILAPPEALSAAVDEPGEVALSWSASPLESSWQVHVLTHPAGTDARILTAEEVNAPAASVDISGLGEGTFWIAVEPVHAEYLHLGARVAGPFEGVPAGGGAVSQVLGCETMTGVRFESALPLPNAADGQTYAALEPSFVEDGGQALAMDFVPSSLGFVDPLEDQDGELGVTVLFPEALVVGEGEELEFDLLSKVAVSPGKVVRPASDFVVVVALGEGEVGLQTWILADEGIEADVPGRLSLEAEQAMEIHGLRFSMDLFQAELPMEQVITIIVDGIGVEGGE